MSASPSATTTALPLDDAPGRCAGLYGFSGSGAGYPVTEPPSKQNAGTAVLPTISAPASSSRVTTVASSRGTKPSSISLPLSIGMPARQMLSLTATRTPESGPSGAPGIEHFQTQPLLGFSSPTGRWPTSRRGYFTGRGGASSSSRRR